ncbi:MAG: hypothetical protein KatS3mg042_1729 [Rhodothermaceae bacterium]|nr:MAG: hypothetical protein KatS3mg042_1729 [Rhodothermaceae bacterium]
MLASLGGVRSAHAQEQYIYWIGAIQPEETRGNTIFRYALDSGVVDTLVQSGELGPEEHVPRYFYYVTVDTLRGHIYWTDSGGTEPDGAELLGAIRRASLDGDSAEVYLGGIVCGVGALKDIEIDTAGETVYWSENSDCYRPLHRTDLVRPDPFQSLLPTNGPYAVSAIELDLRNQMIYWTNNDFFVQKPLGILRAPLNDTVSDEYIITGCIGDIALAHMLSKVYWAPCNSSTIRRANLDGTEVENVIVSQGAVGNLAIDHKGGKIYWTETSEGTIRRANLDGSEVEDLLSGLVVPTSLALNFGWDVRVDVETDAGLPDRVELQDIYPNPVQERAIIAFVLTEPAHVTLEIYDQLGRRVEILASGTYPPGTFRVQWNPTDQANGVYFCRMASDNRSETIVLVLQR